MGFESLDFLKLKCEELIGYIGSDDQLGFKQNQELSVKIMQIEHGKINAENIQDLTKIFNEYKTSWLENLRAYSNTIRLFSIYISDEVTQEINELDLQSNDLRNRIKNLDLTNSENLFNIIKEIKEISHNFSKVFNRCKIDCIGIRHKLKEIMELFPDEKKPNET